MGRPALEHRARYGAALVAHLLLAARTLAWQRGDDDRAAALSYEALAIGREIGDPQITFDAMLFLDLVFVKRGDLAGARAALEEAVDFARRHALPSLPTALVNLSDIVTQQGSLGEARRLAEEAVDLSGGTASRVGVVAAINLGHIANLEARHTDARRLAEQALKGAWGRGERIYVVWAMFVLAQARAALGELHDAGWLLGAALAFLEKAGVGRQYTDREGERATLELMRCGLTPEQVHTALREGATTPIEEVLAEAVVGA